MESFVTEDKDGESKNKLYTYAWNFHKNEDHSQRWKKIEG